MVKESVHERAAGGPRPRVHHEPGRLLHHDEVVVFVDEVKGDGLGAGLSGCGARDHECHLLPRAKPRRRSNPRSLEQNVAVCDEALHPRTRQLGDGLGQPGVEPCACPGLVHPKPARAVVQEVQAAAAGAITCVRRSLTNNIPAARTRTIATAWEVDRGPMNPRPASPRKYSRTKRATE
jgi:hypothetical protein